MNKIKILILVVGLCWIAFSDMIIAVWVFGKMAQEGIISLFSLRLIGVGIIIKALFTIIIPWELYEKYSKQ